MTSWVVFTYHLLDATQQGSCLRHCWRIKSKSYWCFVYYMDIWGVKRQCHTLLGCWLHRNAWSLTIAMATKLMSHRTSWETPRGRYDEHSGKFFLSMKPRFNRTSRRKKSLPKVAASWLLVGRTTGVSQQRGTCTQHNQNTLPQLTVRLSISPVCR
jgi:hypothetical protein